MQDPSTLARRWWEIWRDGDLDSLDEIVADRFVRHGTRESAVRTLAQAKWDMEMYRESQDLASIRLDAQVVSSNEVWQRLTTTGVLLKTEEPVTMTWLQVFRVQDGRLAEMWLLYAAGIDWQEV